ncbi:hypothetical protein [Desulfobacterium sp. N47]|uniref:Outer membrane protein beta-barrel domain-containing protein n=1 Tax=uncultured Desulfobacterium sp. TaxID=201089 RepID=E1YG36_9BACT|nr:unknown protein [uncultured Desulfobacterium sp.]
MVGAMTIDNESGVEKYNSSFGGAAVLNGDIDADTTTTGRIKWNTPLSGLAISGSFMKFKSEYPLLVGGSTSTTMEFENFVYGGGVEYTWENLFIAGEYRISDGDRTISLTGVKTNTKAENYYLMASYRFTDWFELGSYLFNLLS